MQRVARSHRFLLISVSAVIAAGGALVPASAFAAEQQQHTASVSVKPGYKDDQGQKWKKKGHSCKPCKPAPAPVPQIPGLPKPGPVPQIPDVPHVPQGKPGPVAPAPGIPKPGPQLPV
ncbi:hypothetical protein [Streptomyces cellostaticus]|uniref:hypothetical protein n=1 Tax=Streptomyces cellostaticus TaxID=67285 RepID=UPI000A4B594D|nr:hypothetical protein [Streptomyces cellostaticus]GHI06083.1 hypothetical protein Scel_44040 [Streptomyces cellostaticus]